MIRVEFKRTHKGVTHIVCDHLTMTEHIRSGGGHQLQIIAELHIMSGRLPFEIPAGLIKHISKEPEL